MSAVMVEEGYSFYYSPVETWLSHTMHKIIKRGGHPVPLNEYQKSTQECEDSLIEKLDEW